ncbi:MAG: hypothetical protein ABI852_19620 [Gemmatimonadaceae bacterium]
MFPKIHKSNFAPGMRAKMGLLHASTLIVFALFAAAANAQTTGTTPPMDHSKMGMSQSTIVADPLGVPMDRGGSGTTWIPDAVKLPTYSVMKGKWDLMLHGFVFAQYNTQEGKRGDNQFGSLNWGMFMASRDVKGGRFQARTMLSIDAATVGPRGYPLLLQSGELYNGESVHDRQHPHDFFMELGVTYERPIVRNIGIALYAAPSGEPALGPVAFMHRPSAMDLPTAPIGHHWQDATHVAFGVLSAGLFTNTMKLEGSVFNGREPDQHRWDFDRINLDSYSGRLSVNPNKNWALTAGYGFLKSPEALHPDESVKRIVASAMYGREVGGDGQWATTVVYGANQHSEDVHSALTLARDVELALPARTHSVLLESELVLDRRKTFFGRTEYVQKSADDLVLEFMNGGPYSDKVYVKTISLGYVRELKTMRGATLGIGGMGTLNVLPPHLDKWYGTRTPVGALFFLRVRPVLQRGGMAMNMPGMKH